MVYNKVLAADGERLMVSYPPGELKVDEYKNVIRPPLFEALHTIDPDIRQKLHEIDATIAAISFNQGIGKDVTPEDHGKLIQLYWDMILLIKHYYEED